ncbi:MAG: ATP-binding protein [Chloroflexota bacterium]|nr:ATP-binding protein [Chloroflexota bacterium]
MQAATHGGNFTMTANGFGRLSRVSRLVGATGDAVVMRLWQLDSADPEELRYPIKMFIWIRWALCLAGIVLMIYRPESEVLPSAILLSFIMISVVVNAVVHGRVTTNRSVPLQWMFAISVLDVTLITTSIVIDGGFDSHLLFIFYYPALAWFAAFFTSLRLSFAWVTLVAMAYAIVSVTAGEGLDLAMRDEKVVVVRIIVMYAVVALVSLISRAEKMRRQEALKRERELQRERMEVSQTIHDTTAQSVYMVGLGVESALEMARGTSHELIAKLEATLALAKSAMWELRHPIDTGLIFGGKALNQVLRAHAATFTSITSIPTEVVQSGTEPPVSAARRSMLFSIAHNALTNALRHSGATAVVIALDFHEDGLRMSISDDGIGLPHDYAERGQGFKNMRASAEGLGGRLAVDSGGSGRGTTVTCEIEHAST